MAKSSRSDTATYEEAKTHLKAAFEHSIAAGRDVWELTEFAFEKFGDTLGPYLNQFFNDVHEDRVKIQGLTESAKMAVLAHHVTAEERQAMIREAAYLRAEQRGFVSGSPEEDWLLAEQEIDERLVQQSGLVTKGRQAVTSATTNVEQELGSMKAIITHWLEGNSGVARKSNTKKAPKKKVVAKKSAPVKTKKADKTKGKKVARKKTSKKEAKGK